MTRNLVRLMPVFAFAGWVGFPVQANASLDLETFLDWAAICNEQPLNQEGRDKCWFAKAYLVGAVEGIFATEKRGNAELNPAICRYPNDVTGTELFREFVSFAKSNKAAHGLSPTSPTSRFVFEFLASQRSCRGTKQ